LTEIVIEDGKHMKTAFKSLTMLMSVAVLGGALMAQTSSASRNDGQIQQNVTSLLQGKQEFKNVNSNVEDGIVTLTGNVDLYQKKVDVEKKVRKTKDVKGVRNLVQVAGTVSDQQLQATLNKKLVYERVGYADNTFSYYTLGVKDGVVTIGGETYSDVARDAALSEVRHMAGVKDVVDDIKVLPTSINDDHIRVRTARAIYRDPVLGRYAMDPARPIKIIVDRGHVTLYGTVENAMDKQIAGMRANGVFGAFTVQNNLIVENDRSSGM
jgi:hyperosmotically inducible protein